MVRSNSPNAHLDISVVRSAIDMGHRMIDQIINGVHHGSDEVRGILCEEIDYVLECKVCRNLFRSFANLVAHKRIYCQETVEEKLEREGAVPVRVEDETVIVQPRAPPESKSSKEASGHPNQQQFSKTAADGRVQGQAASVGKSSTGGQRRDVTHEVISNKFDGKSVDYQFYTKIAENLEVKKSARITNTVLMTPIPTNPHAVVVTHAKGDQSGMAQAKADHSPKSATQGSPKKTGPVGSNSSLSNICMKLASNPSNTATVTDSSVACVQSKRARKSTPTKKSKEYIICYPDHTVKKLKSEDDDDDMDIDLSLAAILPTEHAGKDGEKEWMKRCDIRTKTCKTCETQCESLSGLKNHMIHVHALRIGDHKCPRCDKYYVTVKNVCRHLRTHHNLSEVNIQRFKLNYNRMKIVGSKKAVSTDSKQDVEYKPAVHVAKGQKNVSSLLSKKTENRNAQSEKRDWLKHVDVVKQVCKICKAVFEKFGNMKVHMMRVHKFFIGNFKCCRCGHFFSTRFTLKRHLIQVHHLSESQRTHAMEVAEVSHSGTKHVADIKLKKSSSVSNSPAVTDSVLYSTLSGRADDLDAKIKQEIKGLSSLQRSDTDIDLRKAGKESATKELGKAVAKEPSKSQPKSEPARSVGREAGKSLSKESPRSVTKGTPKSINSQGDKLLSLTKESSKTVIKESPKSTTKESTKSVSKELAKSATKDLSKSLSKDSPKSASKDISKSVTKETLKAGSSEASPTTSSSSSKKPASRTINFSVKPVPASSSKTPKSDTQNGDTSSSVQNESKPVFKSSKSDSKEKKQSSSIDKGKIPARLSRPMKHTKQSVLPLRKVQRSHATSSVLHSKTSLTEKMDAAELARFEREMKKLQNSAGFVESSVYDSGGDSGAISLRRRHADEDSDIQP